MYPENIYIYIYIQRERERERYGLFPELLSFEDRTDSDARTLYPKYLGIYNESEKSHHPTSTQNFIPIYFPLLE